MCRYWFVLLHKRQPNLINGSAIFQQSEHTDVAPVQANTSMASHPEENFREETEQMTVSSAVFERSILVHLLDDVIIRL